MPLLQSLLRFRKSEADSPVRSRRPWPRVRRSQSAAVVLEAHLQRNPTDAPSPTAHVTEVPDFELGHQSNDSNEPPKSLHGSSRFRGLMNRLRSNKSLEKSSLSQAFEYPELLDIEEAQNTDPIKRQPLPYGSGEFTGEAESQEQNCQVSGQTVQSQESAHTDITVCRRTSRRIPLPMQDLGENWNVDAYMTQESYDRENMQSSEISDPFSDGKMVDSYCPAPSSSHYSDDPLQGESEVSYGPKAHCQTESSSQQASIKSYSEDSQHDSHDLPPPRLVSERERFVSHSRQFSDTSRMSRLDSADAVKSFNKWASRFNLPFEIGIKKLATEEVTAEEPEEEMTLDVDNPPERRRGLFGRLRSAKSTWTLGKASSTVSPPLPKLRRIKTFANLKHRPEPLTSLRGFSLERLGFLGGSTFLTIPHYVIPCALQLPTCIVASVTYLWKFCFTIGAEELFLVPGDLKKATRLYDHFAFHVHSAAKDEHGIARAMRVATLPSWHREAPVHVLSLGWALKAFLAGLPGGILGSSRLYEALRGIYHYFNARPGLDVPLQLQHYLLARAIVALTSQIRCSLICAIFGLLDGLLGAKVDNDASVTSPQHLIPPFRRESLSRAFGPLMTGTASGTGVSLGLSTEATPGPAPVWLERDEECVVYMLVQHWTEINQVLRRGVKQGFLR